MELKWNSPEMQGIQSNSCLYILVSILTGLPDMPH